MKFKKVLMLIFFALVSVSGVLFGCQGKYDNMKITSDRDETGLQLYLGEDSTIEGGPLLSVGTITFTISGVGDDVSKKLLYNYDHDIVKILDVESNEHQTTVKLQAISGGSTQFTAISEEGGKKDTVNIECIRKITSLSFNSEFKPAIFNEENSSITFSSQYLVYNQDTTQTEVKYYLVSGYESATPISIDGVSLTEGGVLTLSKTVAEDVLHIMVQSSADMQLHSWVDVHLISPIKTDDIEILPSSDCYKDGRILLTLNGENNEIEFTVLVHNTTEDISFNYKLVEVNNTSSSNVNCVYVSNALNYFKLSALDIGKCWLILEIEFDQYTDLNNSLSVSKTLNVEVIQLPSTIAVNGIDTDFNDVIFTYYKNNLGKQYFVNVGEELAYEKQFLLVAEDKTNFTISRQDGSLIDVAELKDGAISGQYSLLSSGDSFYIKGNLKNQTARIYVYAYGTLEYNNPLKRTLTLTTYLGSQNVTATDFTTLNGEVENTYFVEVGKTFTLNYEIDSSSSARGIKLLGLEESPLSEYVSVSVGEGNYPTINVTALKQGKLSCKLVLDNLVESDVFTIWCFVAIDYNNKGGYALSVDSPLTNRNIAEANYDINKCLQSFVMSLGTGVQMYLSTNPGDATIYGIKYEPVIIVDGVEEIDGSDYFTVNKKSGFVIAKKFMQQEEGRKSYVKVTVSSLRTDENGVVELVYDYDAIKYVNVEVYIPLNNVSTSKSEMTLYWKDKLNPMQIANGVYSDVVSLRLDPISINKDKLRIKWDAGADIVRSEDNSNLSCTLYAYNAPEEAGYKSVYTLTVTVNYYSTTIVKRVALNVIKPVWADKISAYVEDDYDNSTAYFDVHEYGEDFSNVSPIKIHTKAFSASGEENVTFNKMYYKVDPAYRNYARVDDKDGTITPLIAGSFDIMVFAEDMISASSTSFDLIPTQYKVIHVVIADGKSEFTALRIRTEEEFSKLLQVNENYSQSIAVSDDSDEGKEPLYYYMANNITLKNNKSYFATKFYDNLDGRNQHLENLSINENGALFGEIKENSSISNLNVYVSLTEELNLADKDYKFAGLTLNNSGMLKNVYVNFVNANLTVTSSSVQSLSVAGLTLNNNGTIDFCHVVMSLNVASLNDCRISTLSIGGLVGNNNNYISGLNNNYDYYSGTTQEYEFDGSIFVSVKISAEQSNIGAVAGVNNNNGIIGAYDNGVAVDARIMAKNINNVGGIAGKNLSTIKNVLAKVDIIANNNIGGVAGLSCNESKSVAEINNAVVELYQDVIDLEKFATIIGNENVGGVVGLLNGNLVSKFNTDTEEDENEINHTILSNSYIKSYADKCFISGNENVGGLIGNAIFANIQSCYANVDLKKFDAGNLQIADMTNVGGIAGLIEASNVSKAYYIGSAEGELIGSLFGNVSHNDYQQTTVSQFYSPVNAEFVASGAEADYSIINSHNFVEDLTDASIYENWAITNTENELYANDWFIDSSKNSGYPQLIFGNIIMHKLMPNDLFISPKLDVKKVNDALLVYTNENIYIDDILKITTDVDVRATIYVFSDVNNVLLPNSTNKLSAKTYLRSTTNQVITLTFVLGNNPNIRRSIQVAFIDKVLALKTNSIRIKKGASDTIIAEFAKQLNKQNENVFELVAQNYYKLGINFNEEYFGEENAKLKIFDANIETIGEQKVILFNNNSILKGLESVAKDFVIKLYHQITYTNLAEEVKNEYIEVANSNLNVEVYAGASNIGITNSKIDMTLIEDVTFDVILKTDRSDDQIVLTLKSPFVYAEGIASSDIVDENEEKPRVKLSDNCETATDRNSAKLILSVLNISPSILSDGELIATFNLKFNEKYLNTQQTESIFNQVFNFEISFSDIEAKLSTKVDVTAKPQRLLKIDVAHYPVGVVDGVEYTLTSTLSNNLTPGQEGLLVIDIYPEYAQFDQILIKSGTDNKGNRISFIQVAKYDISGTSESKFLELRPSAVITDDGIILQRISNITSLHSEFSNEEYTFDGKFYVKTLMGTNVDFDQLINLEVIGKSTIKDETGNITESYEISKPIDIMVNQAPLVKLEYKDQLYKKFVQHQTEDIQNNNGIRTDLYNLTTAGTTLQFDISYYKLSLSHLNLKINAIDLSTGKELKHVEDGEEVIEKHWHHNIEGDKLYLTIEDTCPSGVLLKFSVTGEEFVSDYKETYESNSFEFVVVDYIITGIDVNEGNYTFIVGDITPVAVSLATVKGTQSKQKEYASIKDLENEINYHTKYWYNGAQDNAPAWSFTRHTDLSDSAEFDIYDVYGTPYPDKDNLFGYKLNVYAKKQTGDGTFKVEVPYFYDFTAYATTFGGINLNCDEAIQYNEDLKRIVKMDLKTVTNIDDPIPVYTIEEFYKMQENADIDYILMNDLHFGVPETLAGNLPSGWEPGTYTTAPYTPFALGVKSFDGNTHVIDIYGNINIPNNETNVGLFTTINQGTILVNLFVNYLPVNEVTPLGRQYAINLSINNTNNVVGDESVNVSTISFGGLAGVNNGVISNCIVNYLGNLNIQLKNGESEVNIAGFVSQNSGKITYSTVMGPNWNDKHENFNIYMETSNPGSMATFVNRNSDLISNCQAEFVGINNTAHASLNAKVGGFVTSNSGRIINSSVAGQRLTGKDDTLVEDTLKPVCKNDDRIKEIDKASYDSENKYFARLYSQANIGGFVYSNSGSIKDSYSYIPMETQARTAGFVYDNSNAGKISTSYNYSIYDGAIGDNFANSPFVGTNEKGEVLNNSEVCEVNYCYYIIPADRKYKDEVINAEPASGIAAGADETEEGKGSVVMDINNFVGFDFGESDGLGIWTNAMPNEYNPSVLLINSNIQNYKLLIDKEFERKPIEDVKTTTKDETGKDVEVFTLKFPRAGSSKVPYTIANELQFVNTFTIYSKDGVMKRDIRMINDIDFADYAGTEVFNNIKNTIYAGRDFDGNGMKISNIKLTGATNSQNQSAYSNVSNSYGLFYQIGTASVVENDERIGINFDPDKENKTVIRNLTLGVKEISSSTSAFTGILAGVVVNSSIKSLTINASGVNVSGRNAVGGLAGAVIGHSTLHDISVNANVSSTFLNYANNTYPDKSLDEVNKYSYINYDEIEQSSTPLTEFDLSNYIANCSYAGGVAGIIDINNPLELKEEEQQTEESIENSRTVITNSTRSSNCRLLKVYGDIVISGEIVGGIAGLINKDTYLESSKFELSDVDKDSQRLFGFYTSGGLVGINNSGAIYLCSVELSNNSYAQNDEQLTNKSGLSLFRSDAASNQNSSINVYPYAIGGLVGIEQGGYILSSFSKTNVINFNAKYAGGVVGYLQSGEKDYIGEHPLFSEVYTTGNVVASNRYGFKRASSTDDYATKKDVYSGSGNVYDADHYQEVDAIKIMSPTGYAGGLAGGYTASELDQFNGIKAINAFHQPNGYVTQYSNYLPIKTTEKDGKTYLDYNKSTNKYTTQNLSYSDSASGYFGVRYLSDGTAEVVYFEARIGAAFGYVNYEGLGADGTIKLAPNNENASDAVGYILSNLFTKFVYNSVEISYNDCSSNNLAGNGKAISYIAKDNINTHNTDKLILEKDYIDRYTITINGINKDIYLNNAGGHDKSLGGVEDGYEKFSCAETYLALRGQDYNYKYSQLKPNQEGTYQAWGDDWVFEYPIYPSIKPSSLVFYIEIKTEEDLINMSSGAKYKIVNDIYLSHNWQPKSYVNLTLVSAKRDDNRDITVYGGKNPYYCIYNINMISQGNPSNFGFFQSLASCRIENVNFVYGTTFNDPEQSDSLYPTWKGGDQLGVSCITNNITSNIGLLVGQLSRGSIINSCNAFLNCDSNKSIEYSVKISSNDNPIVSNVGGLIGATSGSTNKVSSCSLNMCNVEEDGGIDHLFGTNKSVNELKTTNELETTEKFKITLSNQPTFTSLNIGGFAGKFDASASAFGGNTLKDIELVVESDVSKVKIQNTFNLGGFVGELSHGSSLNSNEATGVGLSVQNLSAAGSNTIFNIGGLVAHVNGSRLANNYTYVRYIEISTIDNLVGSMSTLNVGGFVGLANNQSSFELCCIDKVYIDKVYKDKDATIKVEDSNLNSINVGGFAGEMQNVINNSLLKSNTLINVEDITVSSQSHIAGFVGIAKDGSGLKNCLANGEIETLKITTGADVYISGFAGAGFEGTHSSYDFEINNSVANVNIKVNEQTSTHLCVSGFAGDYFKTVKGSVSLGNIEYVVRKVREDNSYTYSYAKSEFEGKMAGFTTDDRNNLTTKDNFSLSTIMAVGDIENVRPASFNSGHHIYYSYNLSGVMHKYNKQTDNTVPYIEENDYCCTYQDLLVSKANRVGNMARTNVARALLQNSGNINWRFFEKEYEILRKGSEVKSGTGGENYGTKLYPYLIEDITGDKGDKNVSGKYFFVNNISGFNDGDKGNINIDNKLTDNTIYANIISNDHDLAITFNLSSPISIGKGAFVSGIEFATNNSIKEMNYFIDNNEGHLFNCLTTGRIKVKDANQDMSGFVNKNSGIINASLSMAFIDADNKKISTAGFVLENCGIIINSSATNVFYNILPNIDIDVKHSGFVNNNSDGKIINCFASGSMFDVDTSTDENFGNTYDFYAEGITEDLSHIKNCYYDRYSNSADKQQSYGTGNDSQLSALGYYDSMVKTNELFVRYDDTMNYNYATPTSYKNVAGNVEFDGNGNAKENSAKIKAFKNESEQPYDIATYFTGDESESNPYLVNNIGRFWSLFDRKNASTPYVDAVDFGVRQSSSIYLKMLNNFDGTHWSKVGDENSFSGKYHYSSNTSIKIDNTEVFALYNVQVNTTQEDGSIGLFSAQTVNFTNFGVVGKFASRNIDCDGATVSLVIPYAKNATLTNCFAILTEPVTLKDVGYYGTMLALCNGEDRIKNSFAYGDVIVNSSKEFSGLSKFNGGAVEHCSAVGMFEGRGLRSDNWLNCFAGGSITIEQNASTSTYFGGFCGYTSVINVDKLYSAVSMLNRTTHLNSEFSDGHGIDAIVIDYPTDCEGKEGYTWSNNVYYNEYLSLQTSHVVGNKQPVHKTIPDLLSPDLLSLNFGSSWTTDEGKHMPIQTVFKNATIVYTRLNIKRTESTGSRLSPKLLLGNTTGTNTLGKKDGYYYIESDYNFVNATKIKVNNEIAMLIGDKNTFINNDNNIDCTKITSALQFNGSTSYNIYFKGILSGVCAKDIPIAEKFNGYAYKCNVNWTGNGCHNYYYGFAESVGINAIIDTCSVYGTFTVNMNKIESDFGSKVVKDNRYRFASAFVFNSLYGNTQALYRNVKLHGGSAALQVIVQDPGIDRWNNVSGLISGYQWATGGQDGGTFVGSDVWIHLGEELSEQTYYSKNCGLIFGGLSAQPSNTLKIGTNNSFTITLKNKFYSNVYIGGVYGELKWWRNSNPTQQDKEFSINSTIYTSVNVYYWYMYNVSLVNVNKLIIGGFAGHISSEKDLDVKFNNCKISGQIEFLNVDKSMPEESTLIGGCVGLMENGYIRELVCDVDIKFEQENASTKSIAYIGGVAGQTVGRSPSLKNIDCTGEIFSLNASTQGQKINIKDATKFTDYDRKYDYKHGYYYPYSLFVGENFGTRSANITLVTGGIVGMCVNDVCDMGSVTKSRGNVIGRVVTDTTFMKSDNYNNLYYRNSIYDWVNNDCENCDSRPEARVGGLIGLCKLNNKEGLTLREGNYSDYCNINDYSIAHLKPEKYYGGKDWYGQTSYEKLKYRLRSVEDYGVISEWYRHVSWYSDFRMTGRDEVDSVESAHNSMLYDAIYYTADYKIANSSNVNNIGLTYMFDLNWDYNPLGSTHNGYNFYYIPEYSIDNENYWTWNYTQEDLGGRTDYGYINPGTTMCEFYTTNIWDDERVVTRPVLRELNSKTRDYFKSDSVANRGKNVRVEASIQDSSKTIYNMSYVLVPGKGQIFKNWFKELNGWGDSQWIDCPALAFYVSQHWAGQSIGAVLAA